MDNYTIPYLGKKYPPFLLSSNIDTVDNYYYGEGNYTINFDTNFTKNTSVNTIEYTNEPPIKIISGNLDKINFNSSDVNNFIVDFSYDPNNDNGSGQTEYTINFPEDTECDILIVGGGGAGGGHDFGGGGGAGGLILINNLILNNTYNLLVGKGGVGTTSYLQRGENGFDSIFNISGVDGVNSFTAKGGGAGGLAYGSSRSGNNGGSGGGATGYYSNEVGGNSTQNQYIYNGIQRGYGNKGGDSYTSVSDDGRIGGGGAGFPGMNAKSTDDGVGGGDGLAIVNTINLKTHFNINDISIGHHYTDGNVYFAGGGGGGNVSSQYTVDDDNKGGLGGGGLGATYGQNATNGLSNTGGGGGGAQAWAGRQRGGNGGSGIVIIKVNNTYSFLKFIYTELNFEDSYTIEFSENTLCDILLLDNISCNYIQDITLKEIIVEPGNIVSSITSNAITYYSSNGGLIPDLGFDLNVTGQIETYHKNSNMIIITSDTPFAAFIKNANIKNNYYKLIEDYGGLEITFPQNTFCDLLLINSNKYYSNYNVQFNGTYTINISDLDISISNDSGYNKNTSGDIIVPDDYLINIMNYTNTSIGDRNVILYLKKDYYNCNISLNYSKIYKVFNDENANINLSYNNYYSFEISTPEILLTYFNINTSNDIDYNILQNISFQGKNNIYSEWSNIDFYYNSDNIFYINNNELFNNFKISLSNNDLCNVILSNINIFGNEYYKYNDDNFNDIINMNLIEKDNLAIYKNNSFKLKYFDVTIDLLYSNNNLNNYTLEFSNIESSNTNIKIHHNSIEEFNYTFNSPFFSNILINKEHYIIDNLTSNITNSNVIINYTLDYNNSNILYNTNIFNIINTNDNTTDIYLIKEFDYNGVTIMDKTNIIEEKGYLVNINENNTIIEFYNTGNSQTKHSLKFINNVQCDILIVGGGGGGGNTTGGAGGDIIYLQNYIIPANNIIDIFVGKGGKGTESIGTNGYLDGVLINAENGENSSFNNHIAYGGLGENVSLDSKENNYNILGYDKLFGLDNNGDNSEKNAEKNTGNGGRFSFSASETDDNYNNNGGDGGSGIVIIKYNNINNIDKFTKKFYSIIGNEIILFNYISTEFSDFQETIYNINFPRDTECEILLMDDTNYKHLLTPLETLQGTYTIKVGVYESSISKPGYSKTTASGGTAISSGYLTNIMETSRMYSNRQVIINSQPQSRYFQYIDRRIILTDSILAFKYNPNIPQHDLVSQKTGVSGWRLVRYLFDGSTTWHPQNDNLAGTAVYGTAYDNTNNWSVPFGSHDEIVCGTYDLTYWVYFNKSEISGNYENTAKTVYKSSANSSQHTVKWYNRAGTVEDPWISVEDHHDTPNHVVYGENGVYTHHLSLLSGYGGMAVWVRSTDSTSLYTEYTINFPQDTECDVLVVGGGGGGGGFGGGGGGGALLFQSGLKLNGYIIIKIGNGGDGGITNANNGLNGNNSSIIIDGTEYIAMGGGGGGTRQPSTNQGVEGNAGGSGGGGSHSNGTQVNGGLSNKLTYSGWTSYGNIGGKGRHGNDGNPPNHASGGGGGAGYQGEDAIKNTQDDRIFPTFAGGGDGGIGVDFSNYFGTNYGDNGWFGGGGGGNTYINAGRRGWGSSYNGFSDNVRGFGGGGDGGYDDGTDANPGMEGTGGGGGGSRWADGGSNGKGGDGGSGIVIIRPNIQYDINILNFPRTILNFFSELSPYSPNKKEEIISFKYHYNKDNGSGQTEYTINFPQDTKCDILIVAGGGAGGHREHNSSNGGAGGGAGGLLLVENVNLSGNVSIKVGRGGIGNSNVERGENGKNSSVGSYTAIGGGGGGTRVYSGADDPTGLPNIAKGGDGGSGGGSCFTDSNGANVFAGGSGTPGQGNDGGQVVGNGQSGGGGGAGERGGGTNGNTHNNGGNGLYEKNSINFKTHFAITNTTIGHHISSQVYFAGGGGGGEQGDLENEGDGGLGGAGGGGDSANGEDAMENTGGGGGGASNTSTAFRGGHGGSGIVIIRYTMYNGYLITESNKALVNMYTSGNINTILSINDWHVNEWFFTTNMLQTNDYCSININNLQYSEIITNHILNSTGNINTNLIAHYKFDGDLTDSTGAGNSLSISSTGSGATAMSYVDGLFDKAISFNNTGTYTSEREYLRIGNTVTQNIKTLRQTNGITFSVWFYPTFPSGNSNEDFHCIFDTDGAATFYFRQKQQTYNIELLINGNEYLTTNTFQSNKWNNIVIVLHSGSPFNIDLILNGVTTTHSSIADTVFGTTSDYNINNGYIGIRHNGSSFITAETWDGDFEDFRIYDRALSAVEVRQLYESQYVQHGFITNTEYRYTAFKYNPNNDNGSGQTEYTINFPEDTECDILIVAGGGAGGGYDDGGGGGAGGLVFINNLILNNRYKLLVGKGGVGHSSEKISENGIDSVFNISGADGVNSFTARGGGGGGIGNSSLKNGNDGGSGGGATGEQVPSLGGNSTQNQYINNGIKRGYGNKGGDGYTSSGGSAGGGGAGFPGMNSDNTQKGVPGGDGLAIVNGINLKTFFNINNTSIGHHYTDGNVYFAGGGGGGNENDDARNDNRGGLGGGGQGSTLSQNGTNGLINSGGGGGGAQWYSGSKRAGDGGSGIIIIRYKNTLTETSFIPQNTTTQVSRYDELQSKYITELLNQQYYSLYLLKDIYDILIINKKNYERNLQIHYDFNTLLPANSLIINNAGNYTSVPAKIYYSNNHIRNDTGYINNNRYVWDDDLNDKYIKTDSNINDIFNSLYGFTISFCIENNRSVDNYDNTVFLYKDDNDAEYISFTSSNIYKGIKYIETNYKLNLNNLSTYTNNYTNNFNIINSNIFSDKITEVLHEITDVAITNEKIDNSNIINIWVNGSNVQQNITIDELFYDTMTNDSKLYIGYNYISTTSNYFINKAFSDFKIFTGVLSETEILKMHNNNLSSYYTYYINNIDIETPAIAHYKFDDSSDIGLNSGSTGSTLNATENGSPTIETTKGVFNNSCYLSGAGDHDALIIDNNSSKLYNYLNQKPITISFWCWSISAGESNFGRIFYGSPNGDGENINSFQCVHWSDADTGSGTTNNLTFVVSNNNESYSGNFSATTQLPAFNTAWSHVVFVLEPISTNWTTKEHNHYVYVNGVLDQLYTNKWMPKITQNYDFQIGRWTYNEDSREYDGYIDDFRIYDRALSATEVVKLYLEGSDRGLIAHYKFDDNLDNAVGTNELSINPANTSENITYINSGIYVEALDLDTFKYVLDSQSVLNAYNSAYFSVSLWFKIYATVSPAVMILSKYEDAGSSARGGINISITSSNTIKIERLNSSASWQTLYSTAFSSNTWVYLTVVCDGNDTLLYVNNIHQETETSASGWNTISSTTSTGSTDYRWGIGTYLYDGTIHSHTASIDDAPEYYLDDLRIYDRALSVAEVEKLYNYKFNYKSLSPPSLVDMSVEREYPPTRTLTANTDTITGQTYGNGVYKTTASSEYNVSGTFLGAYTAFTGSSHTAGWHSAGAYYNSSGEYISGSVSPETIDGSFIGEWLKIKLPVFINLTKYGLEQRAGATVTEERAPGEFKIYGSKDDTTWYELVSKTNRAQITYNASYIFEESVTTQGEYQYFVIVINKLLGNQQEINLNEWYIYGKENFTTDNGLIAHYKFDGGVTDMLLDSSGNNHHLTNNGTTFDGTDYVLGDGSTELSTTYLDVPNTINPYSIWNGKGITITCWFKMASTVDDYDRIFDFSDNAVGTTPSNWFICYKSGSTSKLAFGINTSGTRIEEISTNDYFDDNWHFISWSVDSSGNWTIYIDNVSEVINDATQPTPIPNFTPTKRYIGNSGHPSDDVSEGNIDDFRIYDRVLSAAEVEKLYYAQYIQRGSISGSTEKYIAFKYNASNDNGSGQTEYTINFPQDTECDILIVGGGGAGGNSMGGGGGAGGVVYTIAQTISAGTYTVGVGKGGTGIASTTYGTVGSNQYGKDSFIKNSSGNYVSMNMGGTNQDLRGRGGGAGGTRTFDTNLHHGKNGGSGGGSSEGNTTYGYTTQKSGGTSTQPNTLWNGTSYVKGGSNGNGNDTSNNSYQGGGGGGAGATNYNGVVENGKTGVQLNITGTNQYYAAGGGGGQYNYAYASKGLGGSGIGGDGRIYLDGHSGYIREATSGLDGTGSGGGGGSYTQDPDNPAGSGGSGIVIIRYATFTTIPELSSLPSTTIPSLNFEVLSFEYNSSYDNGSGQTEYTINFSEDTECDILIVGGGGAGAGYDDGGGGGAGGLVFINNLILNNRYKLLVGKGGVGNSSQTKVEVENGNDSVFNISGTDGVNSFTAKGGGTGGVGNSSLRNGNDGGSGGGATGEYANSLGGNSTQNQYIYNGIKRGYGNKGGNGYTSTNRGSAGGGGAGLPGMNSDSTAKGVPGGDGLAIVNGINLKTFFNINNTSIGHHVGTSNVYFAGGGGGGNNNDNARNDNRGGLGGGGQGSTSGSGRSGTNALINSGGGGGGAQYNGSTGGTGGNGGSGIILIRYRVNAETNYNITSKITHIENIINTQNPLQINKDIEYSYPPSDVRPNFNSYEYNVSVNDSTYGIGNYIVTHSSLTSTNIYNLFNSNIDAQWDNNMYDENTGIFLPKYFNNNLNKLPNFDYKGDWVAIQMPVNINLTKYSIKVNSILNAPADFRIYGINNVDNWELLVDRSGINRLNTDSYKTNNFYYTDTFYYCEYVLTSGFYSNIMLIVNKICGLANKLIINDFYIYGCEEKVIELSPTIVSISPNKKRLTYDYDNTYINNNIKKLQTITGEYNWRLVRYLQDFSQKWHQSFDNLQGTDVYGTPFNFNNDWSVAFGNFDKVVCGTYDLSHWVYFNKSILNSDINSEQTFTKSSVSPLSYQQSLYENQITGLIAHWKFDDDIGNQLKDETGNYNLNYSSTNDIIDNTDAIFNNSMIKDNDADSVYTFENFPSITNTTTRTYSVWVKRNRTSSTDFIFSQGTSSSGNEIGLLFDANNYLDLYIFNHTDLYATNTSGTKIQYTDTSVWIHIVAVINNNNSQLYVNAVDVGSATNTINTISGILYVAERGSDDSRINIDDFRIYDRVLSAVEVENIYNSKYIQKNVISNITYISYKYLELKYDVNNNDGSGQTRYIVNFPQDTECDILIVAGGGGGAQANAGGGGAGGVIFIAKHILPSASYIVNVGDGATGGPHVTGRPSIYPAGKRGYNSTLTSIDDPSMKWIAIGGGNGGGDDYYGEPGGSGGGGADDSYNGGPGISVQASDGTLYNNIGTHYGNDGGDGRTGGNGSAGAGGGGAGEKGFNNNNGRHGGRGKYFGDIFGTNVGDKGWFAGGGGGAVKTTDSSGTPGTGGMGGGGNGAVRNGVGSNGLSNTGGGGGGSSLNSAGGKGGSGIVIFRYNATISTNNEPTINKTKLIAHYKFDDNTNVGLDSNSNGYNLTTSYGTPQISTTEYVFNSSLYLQNSSLETNAFTLHNKPFCISVWVKRISNSSTQYLLTQRKADTTNQNLHIVHMSNNKWRFGFYSNDLDSAVAYDDLNKWVHLVFQIDSNKKREIWRNGALNGSNTAAAFLNVDNSDIKLGNSWDNTAPFTGYLDDLRIYDNTLSATEIENIYMVGHANINYRSITGIIADWKFNNDLVDEISSLTITPRFPERRPAEYRNGIFEKGLRTNGDNFVINSSTTLKDLVEGDTWTISFWINLHWLQLAYESFFISRYDSSQAADGSRGGFNISVTGSNQAINNVVKYRGQLRFQRLYASSSWSSNYSTFSFNNNLNKWVQCVCVCFATGTRIYINGSLDNTETHASSWVATQLFTGTSYENQIGLFGMFTNTGWGGYSASGVMDELRFYDRELSATEISDLYNYPFLTEIHIDRLIDIDSGLIAHYKFDDSTNIGLDSTGSHNLIATGTLQQDSNNFIFGKSSLLSGDDQFETPSSLHPYNIWNGNGITVSGWFKLLSSSNDWACLFEFNNDGNYRISLKKNGSSNTLWYGKNTNGSYNEFTTTTTIFDDIWHHIVLSIDTSGNAIIYIDNIAEATRSGFTLDSTYADLIISNSDAGSSLRKIKGNIDDFRIYDRALSADEVEKLYNSYYIYFGEILDTTHEYISFKYNPKNGFRIVFRTDESPYSWEEAYQEAIANGGRLPTREELYNYLITNGPVATSDKWTPITNEAVVSKFGHNKDYMQLWDGHGSAPLGQTHYETNSEYDPGNLSGGAWSTTAGHQSIYCEVYEYSEYTINFPQATDCEILLLDDINYKHLETPLETLNGTYTVKVGVRESSISNSGYSKTTMGEFMTPQLLSISGYASWDNHKAHTETNNGRLPYRDEIINLLNGDTSFNDQINPSVDSYKDVWIPVNDYIGAFIEIGDWPGHGTYTLKTPNGGEQYYENGVLTTAPSLDTASSDILDDGEIWVPNSNIFYVPYHSNDITGTTRTYSNKEVIIKCKKNLINIKDYNNDNSVLIKTNNNSDSLVVYSENNSYNSLNLLSGYGGMAVWVRDTLAFDPIYTTYYINFPELTNCDILLTDDTKYLYKSSQKLLGSYILNITSNYNTNTYLSKIDNNYAEINNNYITYNTNEGNIYLEPMNIFNDNTFDINTNKNKIIIEYKEDTYNYNYITFKYSAFKEYTETYNIIFPTETECDILLIGGGGGGGNNAGGGAGGIVLLQNELLSGYYNFKIGKGGSINENGTDTIISNDDEYEYVAKGGGTENNDGGCGGGGTSTLINGMSIQDKYIKNGIQRGFGNNGAFIDGSSGGGGSAKSLINAKFGGQGVSELNNINFKTHFNITDTDIGHHVGTSNVYFAKGGNATNMYPPARNLASASHTISGEAYGNGLYETWESSKYNSSLGGHTAFKTSEISGYHSTGNYSAGIFNDGNFNNDSGNLTSLDYTGDWVKIKLPVYINLTKYGLKQRSPNPTRAPKDYRIYGSNDNINWDILVTNTITSTDYTNNLYEESVSTTGEYQYFLIIVNKLLSEDWLNLDEWYIYGNENNIYGYNTIGSGGDVYLNGGDGIILLKYKSHTNPDLNPEILNTNSYNKDTSNIIIQKTNISLETGIYNLTKLNNHLYLNDNNNSNILKIENDSINIDKSQYQTLLENYDKATLNKNEYGIIIKSDNDNNILLLNNDIKINNTIINNFSKIDTLQVKNEYIFEFDYNLNSTDNNKLINITNNSDNYVSGLIHTALQLNGNKYILDSYNTLNIINSSYFTLSGLIKLDGYINTGKRFIIFSKHDIKLDPPLNRSGAGAINIYVNDSYNICVSRFINDDYTYDNNYNSDIIVSDYIVEIGKWFYFTVIGNYNTTTLYINNKIDKIYNTTTEYNKIGIIEYSTNTYLNKEGYNNNIFGIGTYVYGGLPDNNISELDNPKFTIDKLIFYDKPLTEKELTIEYNYAIIS